MKTPVGIDRTIAGRDGHGAARRFVVVAFVLSLAAWPTGRAQTTLVPTKTFTHPAEVLAVAFSPDGNSLVTGCADGKARLWNVATGQLTRTMIRHTDAVNAVAYPPSGDYIVTGSSDGTLVYWTTGGTYHAAADFGIGIHAVAFSKDGTRLLVGTGTWLMVLPPRPQVYVFDAVNGGQPLLTFGSVNLEGFYHSLAYSPTAPRILTSISGMIWANSKLWNASTGAELRTFESITVSSVAFSPDGSLALTGSGTEAHVWRVADGQLERTLRHGQATVEALTCSATGPVLLTGASDGVGRVWDLQTGDVVRLLPGHAGAIQCVAFSPDTEWAATGSTDKTARLWQLEAPCVYTDAYPLKDAPVCPPETPKWDCPGDTVDDWKFFNRECTSYVAWRMNQALGAEKDRPIFFNRMRAEVLAGGGRWSDAANWEERARALGFSVRPTPVVGAVAHWRLGEMGPGHVAYVEAVRMDGSVDLTEYNRQGDHKFGYRCGVSGIPRFIHVLDAVRNVHRSDLVIDSVSFQPNTVQVGGRFQVSLRVRNRGAGIAPTTQARFRLTADTVLTPLDPPLAPLDVAVPALQPGEVTTLAIETLVPDATPAGKYYVGVFADWDNRGKQSDVTNDTGLSEVQLMLVTSTPPPLITRQPRGGRITAGSDLVLSVEASGAFAVTYQWFRDGVAITGAQQSALALSNLQVAQAGQYVVQVTGAGGNTVSDSVQIEVSPDPEAPPPPSSRPESGRLHWLRAPSADLPTAVITHGWQPLDSYNGLAPGWVTEMAEAIEERLRASGQTANIATFTWPEAYGDVLMTGVALLITGAPTPTVIAQVLSATAKSLLYAGAFTLSEGAYLAGQLQSVLGSNYTQGMHFIGHSLGTLVNAAAIANLGEYRGIQVTILDAPLRFTPLGEDVFLTLLPATPVVEWVDNFIGLGVWLLPAVGSTIAGAALDGGWFVDEDHEGVHEFYYQTIVDADHESSGFHFSRLLGDAGGYSRNRPQPQHWRPDPQGVSTSLTLLLFGESFLSGEGLRIVVGSVTEEVRELFGQVKRIVRLRETGRGAGLADGSGGTQDAGFTWDLTIPSAEARLAFDFSFDEPGDGDWLEVRWNGDLLLSFLGTHREPSVTTPAAIPLGHLATRTGVLQFKLVGANKPNAELALSNLRLEEARPPRLVASLDSAVRIILTLDGEAGGTYRLEFSTDLQRWQAVTNLTLHTSEGRFIEPVNATAPQRFYRAVTAP